MSDGTHIEWCDASWTPIRARRKDGLPNKAGGGWACQRVSPGCEHCYAATINKRLGTGFDYDAKGIAASDIYLDDKILTQPLRWKKSRRIFVCSMTDLFGEWVPDEMIDRVFAIMAQTPRHTFQILTKRPERMRAWMVGAHERVARSFPRFVPVWPLSNCWLGVSVENQEQADKRIPELLATPAAVRFLSVEPLLSAVDLRLTTERDVACSEHPPHKTMHADTCDRWPQIHWVIVGGESGAGARPMDLALARSLVGQCAAAGVAFFYKQGGSAHRCVHSDKGACLYCIPVDLRVRQFPHA